MASDALKIARLEALTQLQSQAIGLINDPIVSSIGGFVVVHKLEKENLIGPLAAEALYAGIIIINTGRTPALPQLAGQALGLAGAALAGAAGGAAAGAAGKLLPAAGGAAAGAGVTKAAAVGKVVAKVLPWAAAGAAAAAVLPKVLAGPETKEEWQQRKSLPWFKRLKQFLGLKYK